MIGVLFINPFASVPTILCVFDNEANAGNSSGEGDEISFDGYGIKVGLTYKFSGKHILDFNSQEASSKYEDNFFDYIYIDAEHTYQAVTKDLEVWYPKLKKNGTLFGDDYYWREEDDTLSLHIAYQEFIKKNHIKKWCVFKSQIKIIKDE